MSRQTIKQQSVFSNDTKRWIILAVLLVAMSAITFVTLYFLAFQYHDNKEKNHATEFQKHENENSIISEQNNREKTETEETLEKHNPAPEKHDLGIIDELFTDASSTNCTIKFGRLMLINPNYKVETSFIAARKTELISLSATYGIRELKSSNGDNMMDKEAAEHLAEMLQAYKDEYPGHEMGTRSCFRSVGTNCGRLCAATGTSDHHTGLTCDLIDPAYDSSLDTSKLSQHPEWQWLKANSYKYGFIDRFPEEWAGGPMSEPLNVDENGSTGLFETWHYRYVGIDAATEIATGKYNDGEYDSLEHYLKSIDALDNLKTGTCK